MVRKVRNLSYSGVESGDGDHVRRAGVLKCLLDVRRDATLHAEQNPG